MPSQGGEGTLAPSLSLETAWVPINLAVDLVCMGRVGKKRPGRRGALKQW